MVLISELTLCKSKDKTLHEYLIKAISRIILYSVSHFASGRLNWIISVMDAEVFLICVYICIYIYTCMHIIHAIMIGLLLTISFVCVQ